MLYTGHFTIVCGHYGCGKSNLSLNLALDAARAGRKVTLVDMDIVNPYFRSSEYTDLLEANGVSVIAPVYAGSTLDAPAISGEVLRIFETEDDVIIDAGGDDVGATVLGCYSARIKALEHYDMFYTVNHYRPSAADVSAAMEVLREIETACRLKATAVVNNSHLKEFTDASVILDAVPFARSVAEAAGLPLRFTTAPKHVAAELDIEDLYPIDILVRTPWGS